MDRATIVHVALNNAVYAARDARDTAARAEDWFRVRGDLNALRNLAQSFQGEWGA
jgi:transposase-like protein